MPSLNPDIRAGVNPENVTPISRTPTVDQLQRTKALQEVAKTQLRFADREDVYRTEEKVYAKLADYVNAGRGESQQDIITRSPREKAEDNLTLLVDKLPPQLRQLVESKDLGSFTYLWPSDAREMTLVIGGIMGQDSTLSLPAKGEIVKDVKSDGPNPNGLTVGILRGDQDGKGKSAVCAFTWPEDMSLEKGGPDRIALALLSYSEKIAQLRVEGKVDKARIVGTSLGGIGIMDSLGILAQQGLLERFVNNLGPDAQIVIAQAPMNLQSGMNRTDYLMNNVVVRSENLLYGVKALLAMDPEVRKDHIGSMIKAIVNGDLTSLNQMLLQSQIVSRDRQYGLFPDYMNPLMVAAEMIKSVTNFSLANELKSNLNPLVEKAVSFLKGQGIMRVNTVSGLYTRMQYLNKVDLRQEHPTLKNEETIGQGSLDAFRKNRTKIELVYGSKIDKDVFINQMDVAYGRLGALGSFTDRLAVDNLDHFGLGNVDLSVALIGELNNNAVAPTGVKSITL